jgi:alkanesulfonate monooxygenase SsuD/methylene tetrahydromethanopterin reductase-like flavin-dependent oxidoreductase (luciferase family)
MGDTNRNTVAYFTSSPPWGCAFMMPTVIRRIRMRFAFHPTMCHTEHYIPQAKAVEELGFHGFTFPDSICYPQIADTKYPYNEDGSRNFLEGTPFLEPFCAIPWLAGVTSASVSPPAW